MFIHLLFHELSMKRATMRTSFNSWENSRKYDVDQLDFMEHIKNPENPIYSRTIPVKTVSEANISEHWTKRSKRHSMQKMAVTSFLRADSPNIKPPCTIKLTRIAPRQLDRHENLPCSFKYIVDAICEYIHPGKAAGRADDDPNIKIEYAQEKGAPKTYEIRIEITQNPSS